MNAGLSSGHLAFELWSSIRIYGCFLLASVVTDLV